jgi:hypothetical protein
VIRRPAEVTDLAGKLLDQQDRTNSAWDLWALNAALEPLASKLPRDQVLKSTALLLDKMAKGAGVSFLLGALRSHVQRLDVAQVVELLKRPVCVGERGDIVLRQLGQRAGQRFGDIWEAVMWLRKNRPDIDLRSPPQRLVSRED